VTFVLAEIVVLEATQGINLIPALSQKSSMDASNRFEMDERKCLATSTFADGRFGTFKGHHNFVASIHLCAVGETLRRCI
jgi:hypothetical protein